LTPDNYDIREIVEVLQNAENLFFPGSKKERPDISYDIEGGSVRHIFKTSIQAIIGFNALLAQVNAENYSIDFLDSPTARAFEFFQEKAKKQNVEFEISTSLTNTSTITINKDTRFIRSEDVWVEAELYFYGEIMDAGGKNKANIHLETKDYGLLIIDTTKEKLAEPEKNLLYKIFGVRVIGKQSAKTGEIDKNSLRLIELIDYHPSFDENYLKNLIQKARSSWSDVKDADEWLQTIRGYDS
jgi:hypothetical protein